MSEVRSQISVRENRAILLTRENRAIANFKKMKKKIFDWLVDCQFYLWTGFVFICDDDDETFFNNLDKGVRVSTISSGRVMRTGTGTTVMRSSGTFGSDSSSQYEYSTVQ